MDIIREPDGVDFVVEPVKLTKADKELISKAIAHYKATGETVSTYIDGNDLVAETFTVLDIK